MTNRQYLPLPAQPDFPDLLTDTQAQALARVQAGLQQINKAIQRVNSVIVDNRLRLHLILAPEINAVYGETLRTAFCHELAEHKLRRVADAPERMAA